MQRVLFTEEPDHIIVPADAEGSSTQLGCDTEAQRGYDGKVDFRKLLSAAADSPMICGAKTGH